jgi:flagellar assembly protein FliH
LSRVIKPNQQMETTPLSITFDEVPLVVYSEGDKEPNTRSEGDGLETYEEALKRANDVLKEATKEAEAIVMQAKLESEKIRESAFSQGFSEGKKSGFSEGKALGTKEVTSWINQAKQIRNEMQITQSQLQKENHRAAVTLAVGIAKRIVKKEVLIDENTVIRVILDSLEALESLKKPETVLVRVNPQDVAIVEGSTSSFASILAGVEEFSVEPDPSIPRGGCVVETNLGCVDAQLETQLSAVEKALLERMEDVLADEYES